MLLLLDAPYVAYRPCELCQKYMFNHEKGTIQNNRDGSKMLRPPHSKPPCEAAKNYSREVRQRACAKISPGSGIELNAKNTAAYEHYKECQAVGQFPDDPIVRRNAAIIRQIEDDWRQSRLEQAMILGKVGRV